MAWETRLEEPSRSADELAHAVIGAAIEVHRNLGPGFLESLYEQALAIELELRGVPFARQLPVAAIYKQRPIGDARLDLMVGGELVVELKAVDALIPIHEAQLMSYLRLTNKQLGLLINFNVRVLKDGVHRVVVSAPQRGRP
ncbi:MAG: GxxExxY protein [Dehalococcoidia bacterium]